METINVWFEILNCQFYFNKMKSFWSDTITEEEKKKVKLNIC